MVFNEITAKEWLENRGDFALFDVRSPAEFEESHIPNARNFYALNNDERVEIGTIHKHDAFNARLIGASYVCKNLSLQIPTINLTPADKIAIYCARGQMRSASVAVVLSSIGYRVWRIKGGYKSFRQEVLNYFASLPDRKLLVIDGLTGSGKSEIINSVDWSIDLEGFAGHRGSVFGGVGVVQKNQKMFENLLMDRLIRSSGVMLVESESKNIGKVTIPTQFHNLMLKSERIYLVTKLEDRVKRIVRDYSAITNEQFQKAMTRIAPFMKNEIKDDIQKSFYSGDLFKTAEILLVEYYDKVYKKHPRNEHIVEFTTLEDTVAKITEIRSKVK